MKKSKSIVLSVGVLIMIIVLSGYANSNSFNQKDREAHELKIKNNQTVNLFVSHGHCSTPFAGIVDHLKVSVAEKDDLGNPLEELKISFEIDPNTFNVCSGDELTERIKTPGLFIGENEEKIIFRSTDVHTMGIDWYQLNGKLLIKGVEKDVKFFVTGIRDPKEAMSSILVVEGRMNLLDWGIDYDKIVSGKSDSVPTKWMHINMKIELS